MVATMDELELEVVLGELAGRPAVTAPTATDAEALEPEPAGPRSRTRCPDCHRVQEVAVDATGYRCDGCDAVWRWASCSWCEELVVTRARQESWRCGPCGGYTRSWWRTTTTPREALLIVGRKRSEAAGRQRDRVLEAARRRRWKVVASGVAVVLVAGLSALVFTSGDAASPAARSAATCATWSRLRSDVANGRLASAQLSAALTDLAATADGGTAEVALPAAQLAAAGAPGTPRFLVAATLLTDACR